MKLIYDFLKEELELKKKGRIKLIKKKGQKCFNILVLWIIEYLKILEEFIELFIFCFISVYFKFDEFYILYIDV